MARPLCLRQGGESRMACRITNFTHSPRPHPTRGAKQAHSIEPRTGELGGALKLPQSLFITACTVMNRSNQDAAGGSRGSRQRSLQQTGQQPPRRPVRALIRKNSFSANLR